MTEELAIYGGEKTVPDGMIQKWPPIDDTDRKMVMDSLEGEKHAYGPNNQGFEKEFPEWNGNEFGIMTNSGTAALHMAVAACGVGAGDHVLAPAYSWSSSATCIIHHNAIPVFVDIDWETMNIDVDKLEEAITPRTKAIIAVHLHGLAVNMEKVMEVARRHDLKVIEDACQSHGARYNGQKVGTMGDCAAFSFNQNKCLCSGEGGIFVTNDQELRDGAAKLWNFGETRTPAQDRDYHAYALGWMYRPPDMTAAFARAQLQKLDGYIETQRENASVLNERLADVDGLLLPTEPEDHTHVWYNYTSRIDMEAIGWDGDPARMRDAIMAAISAEGAQPGTWQTWILPAMTVFQAKNAYGDGCPWACRDAGAEVEYDPDDYPVARKHSATHYGMTTPLRAPNGTDLAHRVADAVEKVFDNIDRIDPEKVEAAK